MDDVSDFGEICLILSIPLMGDLEIIFFVFSVHVSNGIFIISQNNYENVS